jgi:2-alkyl-3-oxoalkanoate reductase
MKLLVTGANSFVGQFVVAEAVKRGHSVRAIVRSPELVHFGQTSGHPEIEVICLDLCQKEGLSKAFEGIDVVLNLAVSKTTNHVADYSRTVAGTENLLEAMGSSNVRRIVHVSSFSVYDFMTLRCHELLVEDTPLGDEHYPRDEYSQCKLAQERLILAFFQERGWDYAILRPGAIYGAGNLWTSRLGISASERCWIRIGWLALLPLSYVENCVYAILLAAEKAGPLAIKVNVVDDDSPTQSQYVREIFKRMVRKPRSITIPWNVMRLLAISATFCNYALFQGRAKLPSILVPERLNARFKPLQYSNKRLHQELGWKQNYTLTEALDRSMYATKDNGFPAAEFAQSNSIRGTKSA